MPLRVDSADVLLSLHGAPTPSRSRRVGADPDDPFVRHTIRGGPAAVPYLVLALAHGYADGLFNGAVNKHCPR